MRSAAIITSLVCLVAGTASADPEVFISVDASHGAPALEATIVGTPLVTREQITIRGEHGVPIAASSVRPYRSGPDAVSIAIVFSGHEIFVGNDDFEPDGPARYTGILHPLQSAIDKLDLAALYPAGSQAMIISYATGAQIEVPMGPLGQLTGAALGDQRHYRMRIGSDLVDGLELAIAELSKAETPRKVLIVIGDGNDTNNETAIPMLATLKKRAALDRISTFSVIYKSAISDDRNVITRMIPSARTIGSTEALPAALAGITSGLVDRFYVTFPATELPGGVHDLTIALRGEDLEPISVALATQPCVSWWSSWWHQLAIGGALASLFVIGMLLKARLSRSAV